jgi:4-alpha-glucanotransferase
MGTHRLHRTVVLGFSFDPGDPESAERIPARAVVGLGTHDTPPFASFWRGVDLDEHEAFGELAGAELEAARARRARFRSGWTGLLARRGLVETAEPSDAEVLAAIAEHGGRMVKTTGEGFLIEFASSVDAMRCAMAVHSAMVAREGGRREAGGRWRQRCRRPVAAGAAGATQCTLGPS